MKSGDLVYAVDKTAYDTLHEGVGILIRPDEGRTYVDHSKYGGPTCWEVYFLNIAETIVISDDDIEVLSEAR
mgnify:CR=1 FL=1